MTTTIELIPILESAGIVGLRDTPKEIIGRCPMHLARTGRADSHPSWSINKTSFKFQCWSCHYAGTLTSLLTDLTGSAPADLEDQLKTANFLHQMAKVREDPRQVLDTITPILTEWSLKNILKSVPDKLLALRCLRRPAIDTYETRWCADTRRWVMPIRTPGGSLMGAQYRQQGSVTTSPTGIAKSSTLFGLSKMRSYDTITLVESPLDSIRLFGLGIPSVSSLGAFVSKDQAALLARNFSAVVVALDNDKTGRRGAEVLEGALRKLKCATIPWNYRQTVDENGAPAKDVGDATDSAITASWSDTLHFGFC